MPTNQGALNFVKQLCAGFQRWKVSDETKLLYADKLSKNFLTRDQWDQVLDRLLESNQSDSIPTMGEIIDAIKSVKREQIQAAGIAHMLFDLPDGNRYDVIVKDINNRPEWPIGSSNRKFVPPAGMEFNGEDPEYQKTA
jgi:hypothetical protein